MFPIGDGDVFFTFRNGKIEIIELIISMVLKCAL